MKGRWTEADRQRLRELAAIHTNDDAIADAMGRTPSAVSWQRRLLRIRLVKSSWARPDGPRPMPQREVLRREKSARIDRMLDLASRCA